MRTGIRVGGVAGAATAGALVGFGARHDAALQPFLFQGRALLSMIAALSAPPPVYIGVGVVVHLMWMTLWSVCFSVVAVRLRGIPLAVAAALFVVLLWALASTVLPEALGAAAKASMNTAQTVFLLVLLGLALIAGTEFARPPR